MWYPGTLDLVVRDCPRQAGFPLAGEDLAWIARHLTRTKLGVALGAGGAKGYAHVGFLQVLEEQGYTVDYVGGSSIGGFVATQLALGRDAAEIDARFRDTFSPENVGQLFKSTLVGIGRPRDAHRHAQGGNRRSVLFAHEDPARDPGGRPDRSGRPVAQRRGPLWEALLAALSVAGVFPTAEDRDGHRLIDAIALVPVPTAAVFEDGADIIASVNLLGAEALEQWPGVPDEPEEEGKSLAAAVRSTPCSKRWTSARSTPAHAMPPWPTSS